MSSRVGGRATGRGRGRKRDRRQRMRGKQSKMYRRKLLRRGSRRNRRY